MSFIGSINAETRKWLGNNGAAFNGRQVYVGCSGNFSVEQLLSRYAPKARIWGNDVSLYSSVLGAYLANQPFDLSVQEEDYKWLDAYLEDEEGKAAAVMVLLEVLKYEKANNVFKAAPLEPLPPELFPSSTRPRWSGFGSVSRKSGWKATPARISST